MTTLEVLRKARALVADPQWVGPHHRRIEREHAPRPPWYNPRFMWAIGLSVIEAMGLELGQINPLTNDNPPPYDDAIQAIVDGAQNGTDAPFTEIGNSVFTVLARFDGAIARLEKAEARHAE